MGRASATVKTAGWLKIELFPGVYQRIKVEKNITMGRDSECDLVLTDLGVSTRHAMMGISDHKFWIEDLKSTNGVIVNNTIVHKRYLNDQDKIIIGYVNMHFALEPECGFIVDLTKGDNVYNAIEQDDFSIILSSTEEHITAVCQLLSEKLAVSHSQIEEEMLRAIAEALENAHNYGNQCDTAKTICCRFYYTETRLYCSIADAGKGFDYRSWFKKAFAEENKEDAQGIFHILKNVDSLEYNKEGNELMLIKNVEPTTAPTETTNIQAPGTTAIEREEKISLWHLAVRYISTLFLQKCYPLEMTITSEQLHSFPEVMEMTVSIPGRHTTAIPKLVQVVPVCPGCLCTPALREIDANQAPIKIEFWITPLTKEKKVDASMQLIKSGRVIQKIKLPFTIKNHQKNMILMAIGFILPIMLLIIKFAALPISAGTLKITILTGAAIALISLICGAFLYVKQNTGMIADVVKESVEF